MPCYLKQTTTLDLKSANLETMKKALESLGAQDVTILNAGIVAIDRDYENITFIDGKLTTSDERISAGIRKAYSTETVKKAAKKYGWELKKTKTGTHTMQKRSF